MQHYFLDISYVILTKLVNLEKSVNILLSMSKQLMAHFRLAKPSNVENIPKIPVDSHEDLDNLERFLDIKENFEYMVSIKIVLKNILSIRLTSSIKFLSYVEDKYLEYIRRYNNCSNN